MQIFNTLSKTKEEFKPIKEGEVMMYVCGPTVYNLIHIGNARPMIVFDTVRRYFEYKGYTVNYVSNFTDIDDKIIQRAIEEKTSTKEITEKYIRECKKDMEGLNIKPATNNPLATNEVDGMISMITKLIEKGHAYVASDKTVYYDTSSFKPYGKLSHKNLDDLRGGHRVIKVTGDEKRSPADFVLWKPKKEGEPYWESPWCDGRPGWHIECSVMAKRYLADTIDIHAGGEDLIFPHHENEIAQSEAANGVPFANYWMHNAFLNIDNKKMSKSENNFFTVREISEKYDLQILRFFMLSAHYRSPVNFSAELMEAASNGLSRIHSCTQMLTGYISAASDKDLTDKEEETIKEVEALTGKFDKAMDDDFNTADAISAVFEIVRLANTACTETASSRFLQMILDRIVELTNVLGINALKENEILDEEIEALIQERTQAKKDKNYKKADEIRDRLLKMGIELKDTRQGVIWSRI